MEYGWVVRVLKLPNRELVRGTFNEIRPFSGTSKVSAPKPLATAMPKPRKIMDLPRVVVSDGLVPTFGGEIQSCTKGVLSFG
jgi:hypothetical protein